MKNLRRLFLIASLAAPLASFAQTSADPAIACEQAYAELPPGTILDLLDPKATEAKRAAALAAYQRLASMEGCPEFGYTLGQLYRHGEYLPGNPLPQDLDKARELIRPMAEDGYLPAFADLAEMEMRHAHARDAMKWTQLYLYFVDKVLMPSIEDADARHYQRSAYNGNLLARTELIWKYARPSLSRKLIREDRDAFLAVHEARVTKRMRERQQGMLRRQSAQDGGPTRVLDRMDNCYVNPIDRIGAASAAWIVEVMPTGQPGRIVLENFVPKADVAEAMTACLAGYRYSPFAGTQPTTIRVSMVMGSPEGARINRGGRR